MSAPSTTSPMSMLGPCRVASSGSTVTPQVCPWSRCGSSVERTPCADGVPCNAGSDNLNVGGDAQAIARAFDLRASSYKADDWHRRYARRLVELTPIRPGDAVLDVATGTGFAALAAAGRGAHVRGI